MNKVVLFKVWLRSFFIQSAWNFEKMQNIGFAFSILPAIKKIYPKKDQNAVQRHLSFFNSHPYMASPIMGAVIRMEEEKKTGKEIESFKTGIMGSYGALGDSFFWGALKPFALLVALLFSLRESVWAPLVFLLIYNIPHLWMRTYGLWKGYIEGERIGEYIKNIGMPSWIRRIRSLTLMLLSLFLVFILLLFNGKSSGIYAESLFSYNWGGMSLILLALVVSTSYLLKKGLTSVKIIYIYSIALGLFTFIAD